MTTPDSPTIAIDEVKPLDVKFSAGVATCLSIKGHVDSVEFHWIAEQLAESDSGRKLYGHIRSLDFKDDRYNPEYIHFTRNQFKFIVFPSLCIVQDRLAFDGQQSKFCDIAHPSPCYGKGEHLKGRPLMRADGTIARTPK